MITRLGAYGGARPLYGSFLGKTPNVGGGKATGRITRLGAYGGARTKYGSFLGKTPNVGGKATGRITRLGAYGGARPLYGSFAGKLAALVEIIPEIIADEGSGGAKTRRKSVAKEMLARANREDEEIIAIVTLMSKLFL